jgi:amino acid permease
VTAVNTANPTAISFVRNRQSLSTSGSSPEHHHEPVPPVSLPSGVHLHGLNGDSRTEIADRSIDVAPSVLPDPRLPTLKRVLGWRSLASMGVGATIGAGIFVMTGIVAHSVAGPALALSFVMAAIACALCGLCYAELAALAPSAGSAYAYARASMGQCMGWMVGWNLVLEVRKVELSLTLHIFQTMLTF